jgi:energy-converting hydrogenase Eha subunit A
MSVPSATAPPQRAPASPSIAARREWTPQRADFPAFLTALLLYALFYVGFFLESLTSGDYIAPSDSLDFGLAAFLSPQAMWTDAMYSGYPIAADPQSLTWYPIFQVIRALRLGWNTFMVTPYIVASAGCFLLVRRMTGSSVAGAFSGFVYGFSGVMLAHISHFNQIHAASWLPLVVYGLQLIREDRGRTGAAVASMAFAVMWMSGHPQVAVYTIYMSVALMCGWLLIDRPGRSTLVPRLAWPAVALTLGVALAAMTILPMAELGEFSRRAARNWDLYISKALPPWQLLSLVFPFGFGGFRTSTGAGVPYFGESSPVEMTGYVGLLPLALAVAGPFVLDGLSKDGSPPKLHAKAEARLWLAIGAVAVLLCLGAATPIGTLFFYAPGYARFRVPARHFFVVTFCLAVASGFVFAYLTNRRERRGTIAAAVSVTCLIATIAGTLFAWRNQAVQDLIAKNQTYLIWAIILPLATATALIVCAAAGRILCGSDRRATLLFAALLSAVHLADMGIFHYMMPGYRFEYAEIPHAEVTPHPRMAVLGQELRRTGERVLAFDGSGNSFAPPNLTRAWEIPSASGTGSLGIQRYVDVLGMSGPGDVYPQTLSASHQGVDLFAVGYALVPARSPVVDDLRRQGDRWTAAEDLRYAEHDPETDYTLFRNARARPRAWCVSGIVRVTGDEALAAVQTGRLPSGSDFNPEETALVEHGTPGDWRPAAPKDPRGSVVAVTTKSDEHRYLVTSSSPCLLVLSEVYYPWWRASVDESTVVPSRVNHTMIGLRVPSGAHVVRLWIEPLTVWIGGGIALAAFLFWIGLALHRREFTRRPELAPHRIT